MTQKWNLQDIRPTEPRRRGVIPQKPSPILSPQTKPDQGDPAERDDVGTLVIKNGHKESRKAMFIGIGIIILLIGGIFFASVLFSKTTLTVYPEFADPTINAEFISYPERREGQLSYEIMTITETGEGQVKATGQQTVEEQAKGFIEIIKSTAGAERLIKNTRFKAPNGLIFRIQESVVVPGAIKDGSGNLIPGSIRAEVFADGMGTEYNLPAGTRFDVPGFKESNLNELYNSIYAENREAFTGGYKGPRFVIDEAELSIKQQELHKQLRDSLLKRVDSEKPADFVSFPGAISITFNSLPTLQFGENLVTIREEATLQQPLFKHAELASFLARETVSTYTGLPVSITNINDLTFAYLDANKNAVNLANETALSFTILGRPRILWDFNAEQLKKDLAGKSLTAIAVVLPGHPGIKTAAITKKPFFSRSFPEQPENIVIISQTENPAKP